MALAKLAHMQDTVCCTGNVLGVDVRIVDECGTTGTCLQCLVYTKCSGNVSASVSCMCRLISDLHLRFSFRFLYFSLDSTGG